MYLQVHKRISDLDWIQLLRKQLTGLARLHRQSRLLENKTREECAACDLDLYEGTKGSCVSSG